MMEPTDLDLSRHEEDTNLVVEITRFRDNPVEFMKTLGKHVLGSSWRSYDDYIGRSLYQPGESERLLQATMNHPAVVERINALTEDRMQKENSWNLTEGQRLANRQQYHIWISDMAEKMVKATMCQFDNKGGLKFMYYVVAQIFARTYHQGVHVDAGEIRRLKTKAKELMAKKQSLIYLPCHKSHMDYIALHFICFRLGLSIPVVVAGENLNFAVIGPMLKNVGAMFIRRGNFSEDYMYQGVIQAFIETLLKKGYNFECFIEGTRSRSGKLLPPKFGILKYILNSILNGVVEDVWMTPVSTQYDKVAEQGSYATELLGKEKKKESFMSFLDSSRILSLQFGRVDVRFSEPWSLKNYVVEQLASQDMAINFPLINSLETSVQTHLLRSLGYRILADINNVSIVMPTSLVATVLLTWAGRGISRLQLLSRVSWLVNRVHDAGGRVGTMHPDHTEFSDLGAVIDNAIRVLGTDLIGKEDKGLLEIVYYPKDPFALSYYRNQVIHLFISEAVVSVSIFTMMRKHGSRRFLKSELISYVRFLSTLLSGEFVFNPDGLNRNLEGTLSKLYQQGILDTTPDQDYVEFSVSQLEKGSEIFDFYCFLLWPFIDGYWLATVSLLSILPKENFDGVQDKKFYKAAQSLGKTLYQEGYLTHYEAVNIELLKVAFTRLVNEGILERDGPKLTLHSDYIPTTTQEKLSGRLIDFSETIALSRNKPLRHGRTPALVPHVVELCSQVQIALALPGAKL